MSGSICENCFSYTNEEDLTQVNCNICHNPINWINKKRFVFKLSQLKTRLVHFYCKTSMPEFAKLFCYEKLDRLKDVAISHYGIWGMKLSIDNKSIPIYSTLELATQYISVVKELKFNESVEIIQCFGSDNMFSRLILMPALIMAYNDNIKLPNINIINYFYLLEGKKFSTSRKHFIHINQLLNDYSLDAVRYYIAFTRPERNETEFRQENFSKIVEEHLINRWNTYIKTLSFIKHLAPERNFSPGMWNDSQIGFFNYLKETTKRLNRNYQYSIFSTKSICFFFINLIDEIISFITSQLSIFENMHFKSEQRTAIYLIIIATKLSGSLIDPIMPNFSKVIFRACDSMEVVSTDELFVLSSQRINIDKLYFKWKTTTCLNASTV